MFIPYLMTGCDFRRGLLSHGLWSFYLNNYFDFHVCLSIRLSVRLFVRKPAQFSAVVSQNVTKKVAWYVLRMKNMHPSSPSDPSRTATTEAKPRCVYSILKPHGQCFRRQVRLLLSKATPSYV